MTILLLGKKEGKFNKNIKFKFLLTTTVFARTVLRMHCGQKSLFQSLRDSFSGVFSSTGKSLLIAGRSTVPKKVGRMYIK